MKTPVGRPTGRLENNIKTDLKKMICGCRLDRVQRRDNVKTAMDLKFP
jgi:hypothetical protein